jgi:hypothetical protein
MTQPRNASRRPGVGKPAVSAASKRRAAPSDTPYLRFYHTAALRKETLAVLQRVESSSDPTEHRKALADIVVELTRCGFDSFLMKPLKLAKAGFITEQSAGLGLAGAVKVVSAVIRNIIENMAAPQLLSVCSSIRQFML